MQSYLLYLQLNDISMPLHTLAIIDRHGHGLPVLKGLVAREDQAHQELFLFAVTKLDGDTSLLNSTIIVDANYAEINAIRSVLSDSRTLLYSRFFFQFILLWVTSLFGLVRG